MLSMAVLLIGDLVQATSVRRGWADGKVGGFAIAKLTPRAGDLLHGMMLLGQPAILERLLT